MRRYTRRQWTGEGPCRRTMTPINRQVTLPDRLGVYLAASAELSFSTFGLAGWQSLSPSECTAILWYKYSVHMLCYLLCGVDMLTTTWSDWQQPETHGTGTTTGLPSFHSPYYLFFFTTPVRRLFCAISLHWPVCRSACALFALDKFGSEMKLESTTPKTRRDAACPRLELLTTTSCRMNLCLCVCIAFIFMARRRRQPCPVVSPTRAMPRLGLGSTMCCIYSYWPTVAA